ncbi:hypothetical protein D9M69_575210 [compost metagenome]
MQEKTLFGLQAGNCLLSEAPRALWARFVLFILIETEVSPFELFLQLRYTQFAGEGVVVESPVAN